MEEQKNQFIHYTNRVTMTSSPFDVFLDFKFIVPDITEGGKTETIEYESVKIAMSPQHLKAFLEIANSQLQNYEKQFGEIKIKSITPDPNVKK